MICLSHPTLGPSLAPYLQYDALKQRELKSIYVLICFLDLCFPPHPLLLQYNYHQPCFVFHPLLLQYANHQPSFVFNPIPSFSDTPTTKLVLFSTPSPTSPIHLPPSLFCFQPHPILLQYTYHQVCFVFHPHTLLL